MGGQRRTRAAVAAQDRSEDAPLASLAGGSSKDSCSSQRSGSQHDMEAHAAGRDHEAGPEAPHPGKLCRPKLGCAKCRKKLHGCERCQGYFENYTYYEAQKVAGQQASSVEEVHVEVKPVAEHPACEGAEPESVRVKVEVTVTPSPKQKGRKGRPGRLASSLQELDMENDCLAPLLRVLVLPAPGSGSAVIAAPTPWAASRENDCLHPLLCQHLRMSIAASGMASAIQKVVPGKPHKHRPQIRGLQYWAIREVRLPETEEEWEAVEAALQGLQGRMQKGSTPAQVLQALRDFAPQHNSLWALHNERRTTGTPRKAKPASRKAQLEEQQQEEEEWPGAMAMASPNRSQRKRVMSEAGRQAQVSLELAKTMGDGDHPPEAKRERVEQQPPKKAKKLAAPKKAQAPVKEAEANGAEKAANGAVGAAKAGGLAIGDRVPSKREDSKSCHDCMAQHIYMNCATCETTSYCNHCLKRYEWQDITRADILKKCPRCRGTCICRACLRRKGTYANPEWATEQLCEYANYMLSYLREPLVPLLEQQLAEEALEGAPAQVSKLDAGERATCNRCETSIPDVYRWCAQCESDFCLTCCQELRVGAPVGALGGPRNAAEPWPGATDAAAPLAAPAAPAGAALKCPNCADAKLELRRFSPTPVDLMRDALPLLKGCTAAGAPLAPGECAWQQGRAVINAELAGAAAPGGCELPAHETAFLAEPLDVILDKREGPWREAAFAPDRSAPPRLFCPRKELLDINHPQREKALHVFQRLWRNGEPIVVRGARTGKVPWTPDCMTRACREKNSRYGREEAEDFEVINCEDWTSSVMTELTFFRGYEGKAAFAAGNQADKPMLKVKDFPAHGHFRDRLKRHYIDFLEVLPLPEYTHPEAGPMNFAAILPAEALGPDLGPKTYIAYGREEELGEGDNVTKLHLDLSDAVNIMSHTHLNDGSAPGQPRMGVGVHCAAESTPKYGGAGCVWDIFRREDTPKLMRFMEDHQEDFSHPWHEVDEEAGIITSCERRPLTKHSMEHVIHNQLFMLTKRHLEQLKSEHGVEPWHFEQYQDDAVFIPAGCPHQVRNLHSCTKVAVDFVSPESLPQCLKLRNDFRAIRREDKLQAQLQMMWGADWAIRQLIKAGRIQEGVLDQGALQRLQAAAQEATKAPGNKRKQGQRARKPKAAKPPRAEMVTSEEE